MFVLFWVALGITAFPRMNIELRPDMDFPMITATFTHPGASPEEVEMQILRRAEEAISEVAGLNRLSSQAFENGGFVFAEFNIGVNINDIASEITGKIDALANDFPDGMQRPVVQKLDVLQEPVVDIVMHGESPIRIEQFVRDILSGQITGIQGVASVSVFGARERAVRIEVNPELMAARGATITDIVSTVQQNNLNMPGGRIESGWGSHNVRFVGEFDTIDDIANLGITTSEGGNFMLRDIATITDYMRDAETGARFNGNEVVMLSVVRANDGNAIQISNAVERNFERWEALARNYFGQDTEFQMEMVRDTSLAIRAETQSTLISILIGVFLTVLTLLYFARNIRTTVIASVVIPASLLSGFFFMDFSGFTINAMTLMAMAAALGTLIANAIVLIESALRMIEAGAEPEVAAVEGTKKAIVPVIAAAGTNLVVFLPLVFMGGIAGQFMSHFGMTVVWLTILSLMFSFTLTPMMIAKVLRVKKTKKEKVKQSDELPWFKSWFDFQMKRPGIVILLSFFILIGSSFMMRWVGSEFAPNTDVNEISIVARAPMGTPFDRTVEITGMIEERINRFPEVDFVSARIGDRGTQNIQMSVGLIPREERRLTDRQLVQLMLPELADIPGIEIQISAGPNMGMGGDLTLHITGFDDEIREA
ncbi:MAG: efflux RND transporter permease subunit, partial [Alphaproteobacteria bacterium]|nr:efflux RND transporter permease subunit [Alphaproteobacteria bacterium]